jgi:hypothetical protein
LDRGFPQVLHGELAARAAAETYDSQGLVGHLGFPSFFESDLKTFRRGSFRVDEGEHGVYSTWKKDDLIRIMVGKSKTRTGLFNTHVVSIEKKRVNELTLDDLRAEFPPTRFWNPLVDDESLRQELIEDLLKGLRHFYPDVKEDTEGYMIQFQSYPEVQQRSR